MAQWAIIKFEYKNNATTIKINHAFYPTYVFDAYSLYWNTGNGFRTDSCLNVLGNKEFNNGEWVSGKDEEYFDFYIGNGSPQASNNLSGKSANDLIGFGIGVVDNWWRIFSTKDNIASISSLSFSENTVVVNANNTNYCEIKKSNNSYDTSATYVFMSRKPDISNIIGVPSNCKIGDYEIQSRAKNNASFVGYVINGTKTTTGVINYTTTSAVVVYGLKFTINFSLNGGSGNAISSKIAYYGVDQYYPQGNLPVCNAIKNSIPFIGWNTKADGTGVSINNLASVSSVYSSASLTPNGTVTLYAQYSEFKITVNKANTVSNGESVSSVGTLSLFDVTSNKTVATESNGVLYYNGLADSSHKYRIDCKLSNGKPDLLWTATGVYINDVYKLNYEFVPASGATISYTFYFTKKTLYTVRIINVVHDKNGVEIVNNRPICTASVTSPSTPDEGSNKYITGRSITITGSPAVGYKMTYANVSGEVYSNIANNLFKIQSLASNVTASCYFTPIIYLLQANIDSASSLIITNVTVDDNVTSKQQAVYGETVVYKATLVDGAAANFDGWYDGETRVSTANPYSHTVTGNATLVAKAKLSKIRITNSDTSKGKLKLYRNSVASSNLITEESGGSLSADVIDGNYIVSCTNKNILYEGSGLGTSGGVIEYASKKDGNGNVTVSFSLSGSYEGRMLYSKRVTYSVSIARHILDASGQEITPTPSTCSASITSPSSPDETVNGVDKYIIGRSITITGVPADGYNMTLARVGIYEYSNIIDNKFTIQSLNSDVTANCYFIKIVYLLKAGIDSASSFAIRKVEVDSNITAQQQATYGDVVVYEATMSDNTDAVFDGWYDGETRVSTANPYSHTVTGNATLVAKAKVSVTLDIHYGDSVHQESCSLNVDGVAYTPGTQFDVTLGKSFSFELLLGILEDGGSEPWKFDSWYYASDIDRATPIALGTSDIITPTANISLVADVTSEVLVKTLTVVLKNDETQASIIAPNAISIYPEADNADYNPATGAYTFSFNGSKPVRLTAIETVNVGEFALTFSGFDDAGIVHGNPDYSFMLTAKNKAITGFYGSTGVRNTTLMYGAANGMTCDRTMGTFAIVSTDDPDGVISSDAQSAEVRRGSHIVIVATPNNGYKFGGWFTVQAIGGMPYLSSTTSTLLVTTNRTLYAWFSQDPSSVYEWEGGQENKSFEWRSKTYMSNKPFNPSCCRVDAERYPLIELDVDMFSSPSTAPTARAIITNIASQDARRLPSRRPERYLQVCVKNDKEVDTIIVGTNMMELAQ